MLFSLILCLVKWRLIQDEARSGAQNMARDEAFLWNMKSGNAPILRFYGWNPACLSVGRFQKTETLPDANHTFVRRPTGGRAVWHQHEITFAVIIHEELLAPNERSVAASYRRLSEGFLEGLKTLGVDARIGDAISSTRSSPNCFASATRADFQIDGRKLLGAAQCHKNGAILQHGSLLLDADEELWKSRAGGEMNRVATFKSLGIESSREEIVAALVAGLAKAWRAEFKKSEATPHEARTSDLLLESKYLSLDWNERASETGASEWAQNAAFEPGI